MALPNPPKNSTIVLALGFVLYKAVLDLFRTAWCEARILSKSHLGKLLILFSPIIFGAKIYNKVNELLLLQVIESHLKTN